MQRNPESQVTEAAPPTSWIRWFRMLHSAWESPIVQRELRLYRTKPLIGRLGALVVGFLLVWTSPIPLSVFLFSFWPYPHMVVLLLIGAATISWLVRILGPILVFTPLRIRRLVSSEQFDPIISTPISDGEIFNSVSLTAFLRAHLAIEEAVNFVLGMLLGFLIAGFVALQPWNTFARSYSYEAEAAITGSLVLLWCLVNFCMLHILTAYASGLYGLRLPVMLAIPMSLLHVVFFWHLSLIPALLMTLPLMYGPLSLSSVGILPGAVIQITALHGCIVYTGSPARVDREPMRPYSVMLPT